MSEDRLDYAALISLMMREEAEVASAALRADGIDAFIGNSNHAYAEWLLVPAFNGLQILVPRHKLADAKSPLRERIQENAGRDDSDAARRRDHWKIWLGIPVLLSRGVLGAALIAWGPG